MEQKFLKDFIKNCPITDFSTNGNVEERERQLDDYIERLTSYIYPKEEEFAKRFWNENFAKNQFINLSSYPLLRRCFIYYDVVEAVYNFVTSKYIRDRKATKSAEMLSVQIKNTFKLFTSILILILNGCLHSVITEYRTMYESFVITRYLLLHPELIPIYKDHAKLINLYINTQSKFCPQEQIDEYHDILKKYGNDFKHELGWTKSIIKNPKDRKLITLVNECQLEDFFGPLYKVACQYSHPSSLASTTYIKVESIEPFLQVAMYIINYELFDFMNECKIVKKEGVILKNLIDFIFDDINKEFYEPKFKKHNVRNN